MSKVTREMQAEFARRRMAGESCEAIGADHDVSGSTVGAHTRHLGLVGAPNQRRGFDYAAAAQVAAAESAHAAAERFGVKLHTIYRAIRVERRGYP